MYFEAVFQPSSDSQYNASANEFMGKKVAIQEGWVLEDGPHRGQQCYYMPNSNVGCIPASDLQEIKSVPYVQWRHTHELIGLDK
ncbi:MAG: hypothetical protein R3274_08210 [Desulfobacterales bacterium]|nr:hypothetical protein [Desulfobacterales bacterium]